MSPRDHIKALADRFMKPGAEDLWNDDDGPVHSMTRKPDPTKPIDPPIDLRKLVRDGRADGSSGFSGTSEKKRGFSSYTGFIGMSYVDGDVGSLSNLRRFCTNLRQQRGYSVTTRGRFKTRFQKWGHDSSSSSDGDDIDEDGGYGRVRENENARWSRRRSEDEKSVRGFMGNAALGKYDVKITKRRILKDLEEFAEQEYDDEGNMAERIKQIRQEVNERKLAVAKKEKSQEEIERGEDDFTASRKRFEDSGVSPMTVKALTAAGFVLMTRVQEAVLSICLEGKDALVKARSGAGKTAAFLLPAVETVLKTMSCNKVQRVPPIYVLILCPTRELASQVAAEANVLLKYHDGLGVQMLVGGTRFKDDLKRLESDSCQILVATPGRLLDHIETRSGLSVRLMGLKMLVLDEADHLLDLGFRKDMEKIVDCLPRQRQSLLFSATIPREVRRVSQLVLKREHAFINTLDAGCPETSSKVKQSYIIAPHDVHFQMVHQLLKEHISQMPDYKVIVFCATGMVTSLMYLLFRELKLNVREIHSRKPQLYRSRVVHEFKQSKRLILISSDVSTRGMNYHDVTSVIQVGIPLDRDQYIHRLGRTGREGKNGEGILLLAPWEEHFLDEIRGLPIERSSAPHLDQDMKVKMEDSMAKIDTSVKEAAYHAWLGYYNSQSEICRDKTSLVKWANEFCESIGLQKPPALFRKTVVKMGLKGIPGIHIRK